MRENINNKNEENIEGAYEQFDTDETFSQENKKK